MVGRHGVLIVLATLIVLGIDHGARGSVALINAPWGVARLLDSGRRYVVVFDASGVLIVMTVGMTGATLGGLGHVSASRAGD